MKNKLSFVVKAVLGSCTVEQEQKLLKIIVLLLQGIFI